ncbi:MAG: hypothetical protein FWE40_00570 [Oscillospiraceae bacterium]|nr:hypothetical protein [Oscillospiraceae bacterium]
MKHTKRLLAVVLALTLAIGLAVPAMANNATVTPSQPTGNFLIDTFTGWADDIAQRLINNVPATQLAACGDDACIFDLVWRNIRPWVIGGGILFVVSAIVLVVVIVLAINHFGGNNGNDNYNDCRA